MYVVGITAVNQNQIDQFVIDNGITYPILGDENSGGNGGPGGFGGATYDDYYIPNQGSPYPRDFIIDQWGTLVYANNEVDTEYMIYIIEELLESTNLSTPRSLDNSPEHFRIFDPYPNPTNNYAKITFFLDSKGFNKDAHLILYDINGRFIKTLLDDEINEGFNSISLNLNEQASGVYIIRLSYRGRVDSKKVLLLK